MFRAFFYQLTLKKLLTLSHGYLYLKHKSIIILDHLLLDRLVSFIKEQNHVSFRMDSYWIFFYLKRGCRKGDPISPFFFTLCAEILGKMIRNSNDIHGIIIDNKEYKISQYADDTQFFLNGSENSFRVTLDILQKIYTMPGLRMNAEKKQSNMDGFIK